MSESKKNQPVVMLAASECGATIFRNNVGLFKLKDNRYIRTGLCVGSSDLIGWKTTEVTEEMVGHKIAVFVAIEVKTKTGKTSDKQENFIKQVNSAGGIAFVARDAEDVKDLLCKKT